MAEPAKDQMKEIIDDQPEDSSYEVILRELAFHRMVQRGIEDLENDDTISNEEMNRRIRTWQT